MICTFGDVTTWSGGANSTCRFDPSSPGPAALPRPRRPGCPMVRPGRPSPALPSHSTEDHGRAPHRIRRDDRGPKSITHPVKFYERGKRPLEIVTSRQWYLRNGGRTPNCATNSWPAAASCTGTRPTCRCATRTGSTASTATGSSAASATSVSPCRFGTNSTGTERSTTRPRSRRRRAISHRPNH